MEWLHFTYNNVLAVYLAVVKFPQLVLVLLSAWFAPKFYSSAFFISLFKWGCPDTIINPLTRRKSFIYTKMHVQLRSAFKTAQTTIALLSVYGLWFNKNETCACLESCSLENWFCTYTVDTSWGRVLEIKSHALILAKSGVSCCAIAPLKSWETKHQFP